MPNNDDPLKTQAAIGSFAGSAVASDMTGMLGDFILVKKIGAGAMGDVYLGKHKATGEMVAIKLITDRHCRDEDFVKRFKREIDVLMKLNHPNIARAIGYGIDHERSFLALEFIEGPSLSDVLHERGALFEQDVLTIAIQVARGLASAYNEAGLVHRDIKPMNLLVKQHHHGARSGLFMEAGDQVKIIDFGLAKPIDSEEQRLTLTGIVMGTPGYMSPEQIRCEASLDFHSDMYALGATMFHLLTGRIPFPGSTAPILMTGHLTLPVPDPGELVPSLSTGTRTVVMTAMAKMARDRHSDFRALIRACEKTLNELSQIAPGTGRLLRKPLVRGMTSGATTSDAPPSSPPPRVEEETMDFPSMPGDRDTDRLQHKLDPATHKVTVAQRHTLSFSATHVVKTSPSAGGADALEAKHPVTRPPPQAALPTNNDAGSEALRRALTDKFAKVRTTVRLRKKP